MVLSATPVIRACKNTKRDRSRLKLLGYNLRQAVPFIPSIRLVTSRDRVDVNPHNYFQRASLCFETRSLSISGFPVLVRPIADIAALSAVGLPMTCDLFTHRAVNECAYRGAQAG